jgi:hypothetical protein
VYAVLQECKSCPLRRAGIRGRRRNWWIILGGRTPLCQSNTRGDDERTGGTLEHGADDFDCAYVDLAVFPESGPIVPEVLKAPESCVNNGVGCGGSVAQAFQVLEITSLYLSAGVGQRLSARIAARKTEYMVACADKFRDDPGTDETCCTC